MTKKIGMAFIAALTLALPLKSFSETTVTEKIQEAGQDTAKTAKKGYRATKDALCMKGDVACAAQKMKHKAKNAGDEIEDKVDDVKKKIN